MDEKTIVIENGMQVAVRQVWQFGIADKGETIVEMPAGSDVLCCKMQGGRLCIWALVIPWKATEERKFCAYFTGEPIERSCDKLQFVDTVLVADGLFVLHVFEVN